MMVDVILKYGNATAFWNRMSSIGHPKRKNEDGSDVIPERQAFNVLTPPREDIYLYFWLRARMTADDADKMPPDNNPAFAIMWRSDEFVDEVLLPEPEMEVKTFNIDGIPNGTRMQRVGVFS